mmetsp:Transcript_17713/g.26242  ORF Transcript_17713/g.26242 Transcript_17713/m.26242 type:complete len:198 (-) Transcript_17713:47-640(-)
MEFRRSSIWNRYALAQTVSIFSVFRVTGESLNLYNDVWLGLYVVSSLYSFWWDVFQDWGLGDRKHKWLSDRRMHSRKWIYYATMIIDLLLRFNWLYTFIPPGLSTLFKIPDYFTTIAIVLEIFRRTLWGFFRLENEHLRNTQGYRSIDVVPLHLQSTSIDESEKSQGGRWVIIEVVVVAISTVTITFIAVVTARGDL